MGSELTKPRLLMWALLKVSSHQSVPFSFFCQDLGFMSAKISHFNFTEKLAFSQPFQGETKPKLSMDVNLLLLCSCQCKAVGLILLK